ncbi:MAG: hypothetical protein LBL98_06255 [Ruminococcus sp.]|jgi:hypothetical protein|nr:hypothetical protein [Ruminococcus sp.]
MTKEYLKIKIDYMPEADFNEFAAKIIAFLPHDELTEDEELLKLANERIEAYGGFEEAKKHFIPHEEVMTRLGITEEDIENAEDVELI